MAQKISVRFIQLMGGLLVLFAVFSAVAGLQASTAPRERAIIGMTWGVILLWVVAGGLVMRRFRRDVQRIVREIQVQWQVKFTLFCILLALIEEAITTTMTNLAPLFGVKVDQAYITASANYLDVVLFHSVVVFVPMFMAWAWMLRRWNFSSEAVFLLFGLTGNLAESLSFGGNVVGIGFWTYVYGLMIYLPATSVPKERGAHPPQWYHYPVAVVLPFVVSIPMALIVLTIHPTSIHFQ